MYLKCALNCQLTNVHFAVKVCDFFLHPIDEILTTFLKTCEAALQGLCTLVRLSCLVR